jgi:thiol-disulfide isomerase/thioredoxin
VVKPWLAMRDKQLELINKERGITQFFKRLIAQEVKANALTQLNNYARIDVRMKQRDLVSFMLVLYKDVSVKADALPAGPCFYEFADSYIGYMEARGFANFQEKGSNPKMPLLYYGISIDSANRLVSEKGKMYMNWLVIKNNYDSKVAEAMLAQAIAAKCQEKQLTELRPLMLEFGSRYPNSVLIPGLKNKIQLLDASLTANGYNKDIAIATNYREISSIYQLVNQYKGKVIYLDVWGTWCAPCRYELGFTPRLKQQFEGKDVMFIYLDMDDDSKDGQWREFLKVNNLIGVHLRKSNQDIKRIWEELQPLKDKQGMYPSYFIFDKNGHLVPETAKRPSEGTELYKQIEKYLL